METPAHSTDEGAASNATPTATGGSVPAAERAQPPPSAYLQVGLPPGSDAGGLASPSSLESQSGSVSEEAGIADSRPTQLTQPLTPLPPPPSVAQRSPHSIASAPSALHRIAEVPDGHANAGANAALAAADGDASQPPQPSPSPSPSVPGSEPGQLALGAHDQLGITAISGPVLTSTPTAPAFGLGGPFPDPQASSAAAAAAAAASRRRPFQRTLSMPLGDKLGPLQKPQRSAQRIPTKRAASSTSVFAPGQQRSQDSPSGSAGSPASHESVQQQQQRNAFEALREDARAGFAKQTEVAIYDGENSVHVDADDSEDSAPFPSLLADTLQLSISTLLQLISPHLLDPSHERYSASSIQVPVTSIEALLESHRALNWLCAKMDDYGAATSPSTSTDFPTTAASASSRRIQQGPNAEASNADADAALEEVILVGDTGSSPTAAPDSTSETGLPASESQTTTSVNTPSQAPSSLSLFSKTEFSTAASSLQMTSQAPTTAANSGTKSALIAAARQIGDGISARLGIDGGQPSTSASVSSPAFTEQPKEVDFDIAELVQRAADAVSGQAAARGVELTLCPPTYCLADEAKGGIKNAGAAPHAAATALARTLGISVRGDEGAVRFGMLHALGKIVDQCERGETVHAALCVTEGTTGAGDDEASSAKGKGRALADDELHCCLHIYRKKTDVGSAGSGADATPVDDDATATAVAPASSSSSRPGPRPLERALSTKFLQSISCNVTVRDVPWPAVLKDHGRSLTDSDLSQAKSSKAPSAENATQTAASVSQAWRNAHQCTLHYHLKRGGPLLEAAAVDLRESFSRQRYLPSISVGREPSLGELVSFVESELRAKSRTVALHARADSTGAKQLISMLSSWGCSVALFPLPRSSSAHVADGAAAGAADGAGLSGLDPAEPLAPGEDTGLWAGVPHEYGSPLDILGGGGGLAGDPDASMGSEVDALGMPIGGDGGDSGSSGPVGTQRMLRTAVALVPDGKPSLVSYPSGLQLPLLPPSSSGDGVRRPRGSMDTVIAGESEDLASATAAAASPVGRAVIDAAVLDPVTGVPLAVTGTDASASADAKGSSEGSLAAGLSSQIVPFSFVIIDDDVEVLQRELLRLQSAVPMLRSAMGSPLHTPGISQHWDPMSPRTGATKPSAQKTRPPLPHRGTSNLQIQRVIAEEKGEPYVKPAQPGSAPMQKVPSAADSPTYAIIHLTSLGNFRLVRDFVRSMIESTSAQQRAGLPLSLPEILVIPKPIGPRRLLTTLHTAVHKPLVDEFFVPIATSPLNPGMSSMSGPAIPSNDVLGRDTKFKPSKLSGVGFTPAPDVEASALPDKMAAQEALAATPARSFNLVSPAPINADGSTQAVAPPADTQRAAEQQTDASKAQQPAGGVPAKVRPDGSLPIPSPSPGGSHTPWSANSGAGKRSHPSSPLPMETLEYFNETASRMGSRAASGMLVQSADGKSAGIFFRPGDHGRSQSGSSYHRHGSTDNAEADRGPGSAHTPGSSRWPPPSQRSDILRDIRRKSSTTMVAEVDSVSTASSRRVRSPSASQQIGPRPFPSGSLFSPEVGIEAVLAGSAPPVATPLGSATRNGVPQNLWDPSPIPGRAGPAAVIAASGTPSGRSPQQSSAAGPSEPAVPPPPSPGESPVPKQLELPTEPGSELLDPRQSAGASSGLADIPEHQNHVLSPNPMAGPQQPSQPQQAVTMTPQQSMRGGKPSALPQPGLLIGAGFAAKGKKIAASKKALVREPVLPPIKVLIVEDNPINQRIMAKFMDKKKIKYEIATNGRDAIDRWQSGGFHLILMDIQLPVMDGIEATREIRRLERSANIGILPSTPPAAHSTDREGDTPAFSPMRPPLSPFRASVIIVALTASVFHPDRVAALAAGCNDYLTKPVNHNWLEKKIIEWGSMQYILLSGFPSDNWDRWREERRLDAASVAAGPGANRQVVRDIRRGFNAVPEENARRLASKLHISRPPRSGGVSPVPGALPAQGPQGPTVPGRLTNEHPLQEASRPPPDPLPSHRGAPEAGSLDSTGSTSSSGSSIRINTAGQLNRLDEMERQGSSGDVPTLATTGADVGAVVTPAPAPAPAPEPASTPGLPAGDPPVHPGASESMTAEDDEKSAQMLAVAPLQIPNPPESVTDEDVERIIGEHQVTKQVDDESAVKDLAS